LKISTNVFLLKIDDGGHTVYPALFRNAATGRLALVDALWPGQFPLFKKALAEEGLALADIETIILTHQDCDHLGCVGEFRKALPGLRVFCYVTEEPYIDGRSRPCKVAALEAVFDRMTFAEKEAFYPYRDRYLDSRVPVDAVFEEGFTFPYAGGVRVIHTPGHTPGHVCLLAGETLIAGDAMNAFEGNLLGPKPDKCENYDQALMSLGKLAAFDFSMIACYHGGLVTGNVKESMRKLDEEEHGLQEKSPQITRIKSIDPCNFLNP
jgi:glyoxylase-like metal-dependent hydrolase (beta-lactamase superfamily II)